MSKNKLTPYLEVIMLDRVARIEKSKNIKFEDLDPELAAEFHLTMDSDDLIAMGDFLDKLDTKYSDVLYIMK